MNSPLFLYHYITAKLGSQEAAKSEKGMQKAMRLISFVVLVSVFPALCFAQQVETLYDFEYEGLYYKIVSNGEVEITPISKSTTDGITSYQSINTMFELVVRESVSHNDRYYTVTGIADHAFENSTNLERVSFDYMSSINSPITIGVSAFENCDNLTSVVITKGVREIGERAFYGCDKLNKVAIGASTEFYDNKLTIKRDAFAYNPNLQYVFLTHSYPDSYSLESCFENDAPDLIFYIPNRNFEFDGPFTAFNKTLYGSFEKCKVPYTGEIPQITPIFKSNMPSGFTINEPYFESYEKNVGSYSSSVVMSFVAGYPDYMQFGASIPFEYTITPAPLTISTGNYERPYGEPNPEISINVTGYLNGDDESIFITKPMVVNGVADWAPSLPDKTSDVGVYEIVVMAALPYGSNYECQYERGTITVIPADQTIDWDLEAQEYNVGELIELNAVTSSGLPVEYRSSDTNIAKIENGELHFLEEGHVTITASQSGNNNYKTAESISKTFMVNPRQTEELTLNISNAELKVQDQLQLIISDYEWTSSDERVAKVSQSGLVTCVNTGTATITLSRKDDGTTLAVCQIKVSVSSSISENKLDRGVEIKCIGKEIRIEGASPGSIVNIFDINGLKIYTGTERIIGLGQGIYIVSIEGNQFKIILK